MYLLIIFFGDLRKNCILIFGILMIVRRIFIYIFLIKILIKKYDLWIN